MAEQSDRWPTEKIITVVGLVITVAMTVLIPIVAKSSDVLIEIIAAVVTFTAGYVLTMDVAHRAVVKSLEDRVQERLDEVEASRFGALPLQQLLGLPEIEDSIREMVDAAASARAKRMQFLANRTVEHIRESRIETRKIANGVFLCQDRREEFRLLRLALTDTETRVDAVASLGLESWRQPEFIEYFGAYLDFARSVHQQRYFLVTPEEAADPFMQDLLLEHHEAGVEVYAVNKLVLPSELLRPVVMFDRALLLLHRKPVGDDHMEVSFTDDEPEVRDALEGVLSLERMVAKARPNTVLWTPPGADAPPPDPAGA